ncbi:motile sperm domain-containing protein 2-like [Oppia nitens]|uniref:motile sperm domain-containing protein 2-like n=1 Tax=Oppia nitens TaxID=1686743 RepID=UPI0023DB9372|nr:motile sperm domain-containing protein 2-like [Oppia nitens]
MSAFELAQVFSNVTNRLIQEFDSNPQLYEPVDMDCITSEGWLIKYCIFLEKMSETDAYNLISRTLKWRKLKGFAGKVDTDFPRELYQMGSVFQYNQDKDGNLVMIVRLDRQLGRLVPGASSRRLAKQFLAHQLDKLDKSANGNNRFVVLVDYTGTGSLALTELQLVLYLIRLVRQFPACRYLIHYNQGPVARHMVQSTYRKSMDKFAEKKQIFDHFHDRYLPQYLGGTCTQSMVDTPAQSPGLVDCCDKLGINRKLVIKHRDQLAKLTIASQLIN